MIPQDVLLQAMEDYASGYEWAECAARHGLRTDSLQKAGMARFPRAMKDVRARHAIVIKELRLGTPEEMAERNAKLALENRLLRATVRTLTRDRNHARHLCELNNVKWERGDN